MNKKNARPHLARPAAQTRHSSGGGCYRRLSRPASLFFFFCCVDKLRSLCFFFQAEDGIRDGRVTGVPDVCSSDLHCLVPDQPNPSRSICFATSTVVS